MKITALSHAILIAASVSLSSAQDTPAPAPASAAAPAPKLSPETIKKNSSYGFGFQTGQQFAQGVSQYGISAEDIDKDDFSKGFMAAMGAGKPEIDVADIQKAMQALGEMAQAREAKIGETNLAAGKKFLEENGKRKEVTTTKSGLQYEVLKKGGDKKFVASAKAEDDQGKQFMVNYLGTTIEGKEFDKSPAGEPVPMTLNVVEGFKEAITTMPIGAKWKLFIPADLAYGPQRRGSLISPNSTLIFELELVDIQDAPKEPAGFPMPQMPQGGK